MIILWSGMGWLVVVIVFGFSLAANFLFNATYGDGYYDHAKWPLCLSLAFSAIAVWFLGRYLRKRSDRIVIDKVTGEELAMNQSRHTLFFVPMEYWSFVILALALAYLAF